jgi:HK97 family phage prohead protease
MTDHANLRAEAARERAAAGSQRSAVPNGELKRGTPDQRVEFPKPPEFRASMVQRDDGLDYYLVEGYASMTERAYDMYDYFGPYREVVARDAFDRTLSASPNVVFRFNHGGTPMANTNDNKRLELWADALGLGTRAYLNPKRADVQELMHAIEDQDVREQSFMFRIDEGEWSEDFSEFRIHQVDLDRGDVGPVTFGANPETLIAARSGEILSAIPALPPWAAREAITLLSARADVVAPAPAPFDVVARDAAAETLEKLASPIKVEPAGMSIALAMAQLDVDKDLS